MGEPLPVRDFEAADAWRQKHSPRGVGMSSAVQKELAAAGGTSKKLFGKLKKNGSGIRLEISEQEKERRQKASVPLPPEHFDLEPDLGVGMDSLDRLLERAIAVEKSCYEALEAAKSAGNYTVVSMLTKAYNESSMRVESLQKSLRIERELRGQLITLDDHKIQMNRVILPLILQIRQLSKKIAEKLCPDDMARAETEAAHLIEGLIVETRESLPYAENPDFHLNCAMVAYMELDETGKLALDKLNGMIKEITGLERS